LKSEYESFRVTKKLLNLDEIVEEIKQEEKRKYYAEWEQKREIAKQKLRKLNT